MKFKILSYDQQLGTIEVEYQYKKDTLVISFGMPLDIMSPAAINEFLISNFPLNVFIQRENLRNMDPTKLQEKMDSITNTEVELTLEQIKQARQPAGGNNSAIIDVSAINIVKV